MHRVDREIMWGKTKKSGIYTTHPKHFGENFRGTDWHWYDVNDCWCFADEWLGKPVKVDVYGCIHKYPDPADKTGSEVFPVELHQPDPSASLPGTDWWLRSLPY